MNLIILKDKGKHELLLPWSVASQTLLIQDHFLAANWPPFPRRTLHDSKQILGHEEASASEGPWAQASRASREICLRRHMCVKYRGTTENEWVTLGTGTASSEPWALTGWLSSF